MDKIRILIASDLPEYRQELTDILAEESDFLIIGEAVNGANAVKKAEHLLPDIILMDIQLPISDGISCTEKITLAHPNIGVIIIADNPDNSLVKQSMLAGAGDILNREQIQPGDISQAVRRLYLAQKTRSASLGSMSASDKEKQYRPPQVVTIFGAKGGAGKTTLSVNIATSIAHETKRKVALMDLNLQFGDVASYMNFQPRRTIAEFAQERNEWDTQLLNSYLIPHNSGVKVLAAPLRPEDAELVTPEQVEKIISILRQTFDYIIIDSPPYISDTLLSALDTSNQIILVMSMDLPAVKNVKLSLNLLDTLHHSGKTKLVINRGAKQFGVDIRDVEKTIDFLAAEEVPSDGNTVVNAANKGIPFVLSHPQAAVSKAVVRVAQLIIDDKGYQNDLKMGKEKGNKTPMIKKWFKR
ncbi:MAG: AAA family ATPase [Syntrophomonadaceae bacterium]|nr:AAA family ATPase [Syntrophomonadaceae bacterium]